MKAIVKKISAGARKPFLDGKDTFIADMEKYIGKAIEVEKRIDDANWFSSDETGGWWQYHKAWLKFTP